MVVQMNLAIASMKHKHVILWPGSDVHFNNISIVTRVFRMA